MNSIWKHSTEVWHDLPWIYTVLECWESECGCVDLSYSHSLPFTSVQVEIYMGHCTDLSPEPFKDKRFWCVVEIGGQLAEGKDY